MDAVEVKKDIYWVGVKDWNLTEFHGYSTPYGSTYNSYLIIDDKITLVDGVKHYLSHENIARIKSKTDFSKIAYIVVNHVEMDHSGNVPELMKLAPQAKIITNMAGKAALEAHFDTTGWEYEIVKTGDSISIGKRTLEFMTTPMLHWPDSMMTYVKEDKLLLSNDGFGQHYAADTIWVKDMLPGVIMREAKSYYANILFPFGAQAEKALDTAGSLGLDIEHCTTIYDVFRGQAEPEQAIVRTDTCDILPSNILLSGAELEFNRPGREFLLKTALSKVEDQYDYIIIDTPPALSLLTVNAYVATDSLIIPMSPEILSLLGVSQIKETIESVRSYYNSRLRVLGILLNKFSARLTLNREVLEMAEQIAAQLDTRVFQSKIRGSVSVAESPAHGVSVLDYAPRSKPSLDFEALCEEIAGGFIPHGGRRTDGEVR